MPKYTAGQRKAYYSGMGYRAGQEGKAIPFRSEKNKESFRRGYRNVKNTVAKYPRTGGKKQ